MAICTLCPRECAVDRERGERGVCGSGAVARVARASLHAFEEPCLSGTRGSGTIFFSGCSLGCVFCQNREISREPVGKDMDRRALGSLMLSLQEAGAHNVNLVTASHFADRVAEALADVKPKLHIPVVYNSSGYERVETLRMLEGLVDIYLPDFKYASGELGARYSAAPDYPEVAARAIAEMYRQTGAFVPDQDGMAQKGTMVRLLVLPSHRADAMAALHLLADAVPPSEIRLSLMSQYTPEFALDTPYSNLHRRVTRFEYESVREEALRLGFDGYCQEKHAASAAYTPNFLEHCEQNFLEEL